MTVLLSISSVLAQDSVDDFTSDEVAELILGIIHFSRWPDNQKDLQLCIVGHTVHAEFLLATQLKVGDFVIDSQWIADSDVLLRVDTCQVLYFGDYDRGHINDFYAKFYGNPVLTIDESNEACRVGGMFCLHYNEGKLGFKVNLDAVGRSQVRIHPGVLRLGQRRLSE